ncbi:glycoside hydrolase family 71 protein [Mycena albidolilacea]|uniref:Glycoside hydrolase family 71 protein n=1 Tax=Mycena albidolilacea TaxID=1033008 RepID=A0AAD7F1W1_9AGAR|nr:glycoside hydrolase family 71 protein [Mycena albidolilacea]
MWSFIYPGDSTGGWAMANHWGLEVSIVASYVPSGWEADTNLAKSIGIDRFALDIGKPRRNNTGIDLEGFLQQFGFTYAAAANLDFKVFISFDFVYWSSADVSTMASYMQTYATKPGQFTYNNTAFVSSFVALESQSYSCATWRLCQQCKWPNTNNNPLNANITTALDQQYISALAGKPYMCIHFGESHYIGPLHGNNSPIYAGGPTSASLWVNGWMPHDAWRDVAQVYISAFKAGASTSTTDKLVYYYCLTPKRVACSDNIAPQSNGFQDDADSVFVRVRACSAYAGMNTIAAPMGLGVQNFALSSLTANLSGSGGR